MLASGRQARFRVRHVVVAVGLASGCDQLMGLDRVAATADADVVEMCSSDQACVRGALQGTCTCGYCSFSSGACPGTGQQWDGTAPASLENTCVPAIARIDSRVFHTCAVMTDGTGWCWGMNSEGQLGTALPLATDSNVPVPLISEGGLVRDLVALETGAFFTCALTADSTVRCWGSNNLGELGAGLPTGTGARSLDPVAVETEDGPLTNVRGLSAGYSHACAVVTGAGADEVYCWGANTRGQTGQPPSESVARASRVALPGAQIIALAAGGEHTCVTVALGAQLPDETLCWGNQRDGRLGNGALPATHSPQSVPQSVFLADGTTKLTDVVRIEAGNRHSCVVTQGPDTQRYCWGLNAFGALGDGTGTARPYATPVMGPSGGHELIALGDDHSCGTYFANVQCWGSDADGAIGDGVDDAMPHFTPTDILNAKRLLGLTAGHDLTCALDTAYRLSCWGGNGDGQLGDGTNTQQVQPVEIDPARFCPAI